MGVVIQELELDSTERGDGGTRGTPSMPADGPGLDVNDLTDVLMKHAERLERLWAD